MAEGRTTPNGEPRFKTAEERAECILAECAGREESLRAAIVREIREAVRSAVQDADEIEELRASERHYRVFAEHSSDVFWICDLDMRFSYVSPSVERMRGFTPEEVKKQRIDEIFTPASAEHIVNTLRQGLADEARGRLGPHLWRVLELEQICKDGRTLWTEAAATWLKNEQGQVIGILGVTRNTDARKRAEEAIRRAHEHLEQRVQERTEELRRAMEKLRQADKLAALGGLVSGVAHEINNPNHVISLNASTLRSLWSDLTVHLDRYEQERGPLTVGRLPWTSVRVEGPRMMDDIQTASSRIKRIVTDLKEYARPDHVKLPSSYDVNEAVSGAVSLMRTVLRKATIRFEQDLASDLPKLVGRKQRIEQVVVNFLQNACQALPDPERAVRLRTYRLPDRAHVVIEVRDEGTGVARENLPRLTDPFFTTKREQGGTGLGLAVSLGIAREHGGDLEFYSEEDRGTTARLVLPIPENGNPES